MRPRNRWAVILLGGALIASACGGQEEDRLPTRGTPPATPAVPQVAAEDTVAAEAVGETGGQVRSEMELVREAFAYRGSGRDPFISLLKSGSVRPLLEDLRVTSIAYNARYPSNSVAVLRDTTVNQRYTVRVGDQLGRMRVAEIRPREVVVIVDEFGAERQVVLAQRRRQEGQA